MSREKAVRIPLGPDPSPSRRTLDERLTVRFPPLARAASRAVRRLPLHSRVRRSLVGRAIRRGYAATTRGDYEVPLVVFDSNVEVHVRESAAVSADLVGVHHGRDGWLHVVGELIDVFEFGWHPEEVLDCGQQALITLRLETRGRGSGVPISRHTFDVITWRDGLVIRQEIFGNREEALEAVGLRE